MGGEVKGGQRDGESRQGSKFEMQTFELQVAEVMDRSCRSSTTPPGGPTATENRRVRFRRRRWRPRDG